MTKSWIIPFIVYSESFKGSRPMKGEAESKEKSIFLLLGTTSKRHLLNSRNKLQCTMNVAALAASSFRVPPKLPDDV